MSYRLFAVCLVMLVSAVVARADDVVFRSGYEEPATCGNALLEDFEACDDGGTQSFDGCSASCTVETGYTCTGSPSNCIADCQAITLSADTGFTPATIPHTWAELTGAAQFPEMDLTSPLRKVPYKPGLAFLGASRNHYVSVAFTTGPGPVHSGDLSFQDSQIIGTNSAHIGTYFISMSRCPGDFRVQIASPRDSTEFPACRNVRFNLGSSYSFESIRYDLSGISGDGFNNNTCGLLPNHAYYLNYINADVLDGVQVGEHSCPNDVNSCGVQFKSN